MLLRRVLGLTAMIVALVGLSGCGKGGALATVSGTVTHNGNPVDGAKVTFHSTVEVDGKPAAAYGAQTDSSGKYVIATTGRDQQPGIPPGLYKVSIVKYEGKGPEPGEGMDSGQIDAARSDTGGTVKVGGSTNLLPMMYAKPDTSKLSATLEVGKNKDVNFDLKGK